MTKPYDFWINPDGGSPLGFNLAIDKDHPYQRATAQFRKEQFDSQATVGDQSLTGWWTRGQLSFHKGAGTLYYEVAESETVLDRFDSGIGVFPFTPGQVSISRALDEVDTSAVGTGFGFEDCVYVVDYINGDRIVGRGDDGKAYHVTIGTPFASQAVTQIATTGTDPVVSIASSRFRVYLAVGENIEIWYPGMASSTVLWTGTLGGYDIVNIWFAKQRLWVVDANGNWYVLAADAAGGGGFATADSKFRIKDYGWLVVTKDTWSLVGSPGPVYISAFNEIYAVTLTETSDVLLPTIGAPIQVAEIPANETIHCLGYALGTLMIATSDGARFAIINGEGLAYGPRVATFRNFVGARRIATLGTRLCTGAYFFEETGLYSFDLGQMADTLQPAHVLEVHTGNAIGYTGALSTPGGLVTWSAPDRKLYRQSTTLYPETASLKTGQHRFGTLDPKWFRSVLVRTGGAGGSVDVYRLDPSTTTPPYAESLLGTVTFPETEADLDLGDDTPAERIALKFILKRDATDSTKAPTLLGYQLRALPLPKRQRMIRVPLLLRDRETNRTGQQVVADPWDRVVALETLEASNAVVTFEDEETGETGDAYIEAVEVERTNPPARGPGGFGGYIWLTLRKTSA